MSYGTRTDHYPASSKLLHWLVAICVLTTAPVAIAMTRVSEGPAQDALFNFHKSLGVLIFILMSLRLINRLAVGAPIPEPGIEPWQRTVSSVVHTSFYVLLLAMPIVGYVANSAYGAPTPFFGLFDLPPIVGKNEALSKPLFTTHRSITTLSAATTCCDECCRGRSAGPRWQHRTRRIRPLRAARSPAR
jgi:cytochrome b561